MLPHSRAADDGVHVGHGSLRWWLPLGLCWCLGLGLCLGVWPLWSTDPGLHLWSLVPLPGVAVLQARVRVMTSVVIVI